MCTTNTPNKGSVKNIQFDFTIKFFFFIYSVMLSKIMNEDIKLRKVGKMSTIKNFIVIEPGLVLTLKKDQLLTEDELLHYQREFGEDSFIVKKLKK
mgnify:CR=1 FL=1